MQGGRAWKGGRRERPKGNTCQEGSCHDDLSRVSREVAAALHHRRKLPLPFPTPPLPKPLYTRPPLSLLPRENPNKLGFLKASRAKTSEEHLDAAATTIVVEEGGRKEGGGPTGSRRRASHLERKKTRGSATVKFTTGAAAGWRNMDFFRGPPSSFSRRDVKLRTERRERISIEGWTIRTRYRDGETKKRIDGIIGAPEWKIDRIGGGRG